MPARALIFLLALTTPVAGDTTRESTPNESPRANLLERASDLAKTPLEGDALVSALWNRIFELRDEFPIEEPEPYLALESRLLAQSDAPRFVLATLVRLNVPARHRSLLSTASTALRDLAQKSQRPELRLAAAQTLAHHGDENERLENYVAARAVFERCERPRDRIASAHALWRISRDKRVLEPVVRYLDSKSFDTRMRAAFTLAESPDYPNSNQVRLRVFDIIEVTARRPDDSGRRARLLRAHLARRDVVGPLQEPSELLAQLAELEDELRQARAPRPSPDRALSELVDLLRRTYVDPAEISAEALFLEAVRSLVASVDPYAKLITSSEREFESRTSPEYVGLGARFDKTDPDRPFVVTRSHYGSPVFDPRASAAEQLYSGDRILEINGNPTENLSVRDLRQILSSRQLGDLVVMKVQRPGGPSRLARYQVGKIRLPIALTSAFENIGYIRIARFTSDTPETFRQAFRELNEQAKERTTLGLKGLVLDLRGNPGGQLKAAVDLVDLFVGNPEPRRPIVSEIRLDDAPPIESRYPHEDVLVTCPVVVLTNDSTASAAEVVSGSLQALGRARIVGSRTFGKGVSQVTLRLPPSVERLIGTPAKIRVPTHYLVLPSGRRFHREGDQLLDTEHWGIEPDVSVSASPPGFDTRRIAALSLDPDVVKYVSEHADELDRLAEDRHLDPSAYPALDELRRAVETGHSPVSPILLVTAVLEQRHRHRQDRAQRELVRSPKEDPQLRRAIAELRTLSR
ncbi:MAG: S41 family peptidase [Planctomycetota bacterium]